MTARAFFGFSVAVVSLAPMVLATRLYVELLAERDLTYALRQNIAILAENRGWAWNVPEVEAYTILPDWITWLREKCKEVANNRLTPCADR